MRRRRREVARGGFMIAPMIDVVFLLLIFFMVTTKISKEKTKLDIKLPIAANAVFPEDLSNRDIINIDGMGTYFVGSSPVTKQDLAKYLRRRFKDNPPLRLYVRADKKTPGKKIKEVMRISAEAGAVDVIFGSYQKE